MSRPGASILKLGLLQFKKDPGVMITFKRTLVHPVSGQSVTLIPLPTMARPSFWAASYTGLHHKYDRVLYEDGWGPVAPGTLGPSARMRQTVAPIFPHALEIPSEEHKRFVGASERDVVESNMAFRSCEENMSPPVDPRARRGVDLLLTLEPKERVVMPWNMHHHYYIQWRLKQYGFVEKSIEELVIITQAEGMMLTFLAFFMIVCLPGYTVVRILRWIVG